MSKLSLRDLFPEKNTEQLTIKLTPGLMHLITDDAMKSGRSKSEVVKTILNYWYFT